MSFLFGFCCCDGDVTVPDVPPETVDTDCCLNVPVTLYASFSNGTGTCNSLNGTVVTLTYTSSLPTAPLQAGWYGTLGGSTILFYCIPYLADFAWVITTAVGSTGCRFSDSGTIETSCDPFLVLFDATLITTCCTGSSDITVTSVSP